METKNTNMTNKNYPILINNTFSSIEDKECQNNASRFSNNNIDLDINCLNDFKTNASYFTKEQFANIIHKRNGSSIIHIHHKSLCANVTQLKALLENLEFSFEVIALTETC